MWFGATVTVEITSQTLIQEAGVQTSGRPAKENLGVLYIYIVTKKTPTHRSMDNDLITISCIISRDS